MPTRNNHDYSDLWRHCHVIGRVANTVLKVTSINRACQFLLFYQVSSLYRVSCKNYAGTMCFPIQYYQGPNRPGSDIIELFHGLYLDSTIWKSKVIQAVLHASLIWPWATLKNLTGLFLPGNLSMLSTNPLKGLSTLFASTLQWFRTHVKFSNKPKYHIFVT